MIDYTPKLPTGVGSIFGDVSLSSLSVPANVLWGLLLLIVVIVGVVTVILYYHWIRYGFGDRKVIMVQILYSLVVFFCLGAMLTSVISYA